jgi:hypothetical protein
MKRRLLRYDGTAVVLVAFVQSHLNGWERICCSRKELSQLLSYCTAHTRMDASVQHARR